MLAPELLIFMSIAILMVVLMAVLVAEEHRKHTEWRDCWESGLSGVSFRMEQLT